MEVALLADGGDGTAEALAAPRSVKWVRARAEDALGRPVRARWAWDEAAGLGIADLASACGLARLAEGERDPLRAHSRGAGLLLASMARRGVTSAWLGVGGSASVDGGMGAAHALGIRFLDGAGRPLAPTGESLARVEAWRPARVPPPAGGMRLDIIADVANPLTGLDGAARVYGPQKGATPEMVRLLEAGLERLAGKFSPGGGSPLSSLPGMGAAGGLPLCLVALAGARIRAGADFVLRRTGLDKRVRQCRLVVTGEGRYDAQSAMGKAPWALVRAARAAGARALVVSGLPPGGPPPGPGVSMVAAGEDVPASGREAARRIEEAVAAWAGALDAREMEER